MKYNRTAIRKLIIEAYDDEELTTFCHDHFSEVIERFGSGMSTSVKAFQLVAYCDRREQLEVLVERIRAERPDKYKKYEAQVEGGEEAPSVIEEVRAEASEYAGVFESASRAELHRKRGLAGTDVAQETDHPLAGSPQEVRRWFLEKLNPEEQVFVVTAALFSGLERQELMDLHNGMLNVLKPAEAPAGEEA